MESAEPQTKDADASAEEQPFSERLEEWLASDGSKTIASLDGVFGEKSFAVAILLLMILPALPLPTGGITHVFEAIAMLIALQMVFGRQTIWLPERWRNRELGESVTGKAVPAIAKMIRRFERYSNPRGGWLLRRGVFVRLVGLGLIALALGAWFAPPFSGLDTFPSLGAVVICLGLILGDVVMIGVGSAIGAVGVGLILTLGAAAVHFVKGLVG